MRSITCNTAVVLQSHVNYLGAKFMIFLLLYGAWKLPTHKPRTTYVFDLAKCVLYKLRPALYKGQWWHFIRGSTVVTHIIASTYITMYS